MALFRAYCMKGTRVPTYFIESTAPDNVDDSPSEATPLPPLESIDPDEAIKEIAGCLSAAPAPNLVVMVHGYNSPQAAVLEMYARASHAIEHDEAIASRKGLVCVGYRWPSEKLFAPRDSWKTALPSFPRWIVWIGVCLILFGLAVAASSSWLAITVLPPWLALISGRVLAVVGLALAGFVLSLLFLRIIVYFRDTYRATSYGAPDLVEIIRQIDQWIIRLDKKADESKTETRRRRDGHRVALSFIARSLGGYVVTNAIRILSDLFADDAVRPKLNMGVINQTNLAFYSESGSESLHAEISPKIGHAFNVTRFLLAAPDIPAEALLSNRANFLASSLRRFQEAYLFSNEGDEVLRQVSTMGNYFSFPTKSWKFGYRLGNVDILSSGYGVLSVAPDLIPATVRSGYLTLQQEYDTLQTSRRSTGLLDTLQDVLAKKFSYFDCTDYIEPDSAGRERGLLTFALRTKRNNPQAKMHWWSHARLLFSYLLGSQEPDVHSGYFDGAFCQQLMYRLVFLGYRDTIAAYSNLQSLSDVCRQRQIRVLLSPGLTPASNGPPSSATAASPTG
jgi:hypothetical protein